MHVQLGITIDRRRLTKNFQQLETMNNKSPTADEEPTSLETSNKSDIRSSQCSHSEHPWTAQLYAVLHSHETSLLIKEIAFWAYAASVRILAMDVYVRRWSRFLYSAVIPVWKCFTTVSIRIILKKGNKMRRFRRQKCVPDQLVGCWVN
jgi:hypothetical protein